MSLVPISFRDWLHNRELDENYEREMPLTRAARRRRRVGEGEGENG